MVQRPGLHPDRSVPLPVVVVSGFLRAGKSDVVARLVAGSALHGMDWWVQSLADPRDEHAVRRNAAWRRIASRLPDTGGCLCCALRHDLVAAVERAAADRRVEVLVVECDGTAVPSAATEAICAVEHVSGLARVHTALTVVDAATFVGDLERDDQVSALGLPWCGEDLAVAELRVAQVEHADVVAVHGDQPYLGTAVALVRRLNPRADLVTGEVCAEAVLARPRFDPDHTPRAGDHALALADDLAGAGPAHQVSSVVYRARRPFHPARLDAALPVPAGRVLRAQGIIWIATRPQLALRWHQCSPATHIEPTATWLASQPLPAWRSLDDAERATVLLDWDRRFGDRENHVVFTGIDLDTHCVHRTLDACLLTDAELAGGPEAWRQLPDPFPDWDDEATAQLPVRRPPPPAARSATARQGRPA
ncbi:MAG TPA: GTP-binding protein [Egibacteraceae bacterium]|nr:GTP-binding protein [Egibacteraceae bacterium]